jgi:Protein of unknown function (DUF1566)
MKSSTKRSFSAAIALAAMLVAIGPLKAQSAISADGIVESTSGGFMFPDGSVQTTAAAGGTAPLADTGQSACWDDQGASRSCPGTGEDGETQAGLLWPTPRFTDNGDGTITDNLTGLDWLKDGNCPGTAMGWQAALTWIASTLNTGGTACASYTAGTFTDWRLPNANEYVSLADISQATPALPIGHPFINVVNGASNENYWSSSTPAGIPTSAMSFWIGFGGLWAFDKDTESLYVWAVRGGN